MGRQLQEMKKNGKELSFKYNDAGVRTEKTANGKVTKYHLVGDKVTHETDGTDSIYYTYDTWGKLLSVDGSLKDTVGQKNPYRYRGYRYDSETGIYYLQSRYYNPDWGRFINADGIVRTPGELLTCKYERLRWI